MMRTAYLSKVRTKFGFLHLASSDFGICKIGLIDESEANVVKWLRKFYDTIEDGYEKNHEAAKQLLEYSKGNLKEFSVKLDIKGTEFQKKVYHRLRNVGYGEICSYKDLAIKVGNSKGYRAVGMANNKNPIPIIIPCHRVVGSNGDLVGYGGGIDMKVKLLELEGRIINKGKVVTEK